MHNTAQWCTWDEGLFEIAIEKPKEKYTSLIHLINESSLTQCHYEMKANKAATSTTGIYTKRWKREIASVRHSVV